MRSPSEPIDLDRNLRLVVVIPALNESATISSVIKSVPRQLEDIDEVVVLVVDDGSTDDTSELAIDAGALVVRHPKNLGVGAAFATGIERALRIGADVIVNMDADGQFQSADIARLIRPITREGFGFVTCTRFGDPEKIPTMPWVKKMGNKGMCWIINRITGTKFTDVSCGFRAYTRETAMRLNLFGYFTYTQESFIDLANKGIAMKEVPLIVRGVREHGKSRVASNLWLYAIRTIGIIARAMRDTKPLHFFGLIAFGLTLLGISAYGFVGCWWLSTGRTAPWTSLLSVGNIFSTFGVGVGLLALISDQIGRGRKIQEQLLYFQRRSFFDEHNERHLERIRESELTEERENKLDSVG